MQSFFKNIQRYKEAYKGELLPFQLQRLVQDKFDAQEEHGPEQLLVYLLDKLKHEWHQTPDENKMVQIHTVELEEYVKKYFEIQNCTIDKLFSTITIEMFNCLHHGEKRKIHHEPIIDITYIDDRSSTDLDTYLWEKYYKTSELCP